MTYKSWLVGLAALGLAVVTAVALAAQPAGGRHGGPGSMMLRGIPNLGETQRADIQALVEKHRTAVGDEMKALADLQRQLHAEIFADTPNPAAIEDLRTKIAAAQATALARQVELRSQVAQVLTPEQRAAVRDRGGRGFGMFGGPGLARGHRGRPR